MRRMFCPKCGKKNDEDAKYCAYCGGEIVDTQPEEVSPGHSCGTGWRSFSGAMPGKGALRRRVSW